MKKGDRLRLVVLGLFLLVMILVLLLASIVTTPKDVLVGKLDNWSCTQWKNETLIGYAVSDGYNRLLYVKTIDVNSTQSFKLELKYGIDECLSNYQLCNYNVIFQNVTVSHCVQEGLNCRADVHREFNQTCVNEEAYTMTYNGNIMHCLIADSGEGRICDSYRNVS